MNKTLDELQTLSIQAHEQALRNWFNEVVNTMEVVEFKRSIKQLLDSPHFINHTKDILAVVVKTDLDTS